MKEFLQNLLNYRRPYMWIAAVLTLLLLLFFFRLFSAQEDKLTASLPSEPEFSEMISMSGIRAEALKAGHYEFESLLYLSPLSSSTFDYAESKLQGTSFTISDALFEIDYPDEERYYIEEPRYVREKMTADMIRAFEKSTFEEVSIPDFKAKYRYTIYTSDHIQTNHHLYMMDDQIWLSSYADNTADKSEITMQLWKLKPQSN